MEDYADARVDFRKAIFYSHQDIKLAYFNLGIAEFRLGNKEEACNNWRKSEDVGLEYLLKYCN
jgi:tetratricopeptide (TPR) repeat protein